MFEKLFEKKEATVKAVKAKKIKVRAKDIQSHIEWLDEAMRTCEADIKKCCEILDKLKTRDPGDDKELNLKLIVEAEENLQNYRSEYSLLQEQREKEYSILKKYKDSRFYIAPKDLIVILGLLSGGIYAITLERENPKSLKLASFLMRLFPIKM